MDYYALWTRFALRLLLHWSSGVVRDILRLHRPFYDPVLCYWYQELLRNQRLEAEERACEPPGEEDSEGELWYETGSTYEGQWLPTPTDLSSWREGWLQTHPDDSD